MKVIKLDETRFSKNSLNIHHSNHVAKNGIEYYVNDATDELIEPMSKEEYDTNGDKLSKP